MGKKLQRICENCGCTFNRYPSQCDDKHNAGKFCTKKCADLFKVGKPNGRKGEPGHIAWNKGIKIDRSKYPNMGHLIKHTEESKQKCGIANIGKVAWNRGLTKENSDRVYSGERHHNWKGGISTKRSLLRQRRTYIIWREAVFARDDWTCQECGTRGCSLEADHIKPWSLYPELRYSIDNGRTLCVNCHRNTDTWGYRVFQRKALG